MSNTIIGRVKSFKDYWIHLKGYYWSIQLEIAVWIYWIHLKGFYWRIHLEIAVWILDKRKACWIWDFHSFSFAQSGIWLFCVICLHLLLAFLHSYGRLLRRLPHSTQLNGCSFIQYEDFDLLHWCVNNCTNECRLVIVVSQSAVSLVE